MILSIGVPYGLHYFNTERLNSASRELLEALRLAQANALSSQLDSDFGVYIDTDNFTLFKGSSYASRDAAYDQVFSLSSQISHAGLQEIVFERLSGLPQQTGEVTLSSGDNSNVIRIDAQGLVSLDINVSFASP